MYKILHKEKLNKDVDLMVIDAPLITRNTKPGHFLMIRVEDGGERIPLTIVETKKNEVTIIYQKLSYSTTRLGQLEVGDYVSDVVGPLGKPSHIREVKSVIGVAGGVGAAPLFPQLKEYARQGVKVDLILGGRTEDYVILEEKYREFCNKIYIATDDGSKGTKGYVTTVLQKLYESGIKYDQSIAIGPLIMMKNVVLLNNKQEIPTGVSLNPIMIDGTGMCGNCRVSINDKTYFACIDGPDFPGEGVDFDELIARQNYYKKEEHDCNLKMVK